MSVKAIPSAEPMLKFANDADDVVQMYGKSATIHGVHAIITPQAFKWRRYVWLLLLIGMTFSLSFFLYLQFKKYASHPVVSSINVEFTDDLKLPDITICNSNNFHRDRIPDEPILKELLFNMSDLNYLRYQLNGTARPSTPKSTDSFTGPYLRKFAEDATHKVKDMFMVCEWQYKSLNCSRYLRKRFTDFGVCYTLTSNQDSPIALPVLSPSNTANNLRLIVNIEQDKYYYSRSSQSGIKVVLHEQNTEPSPFQHGFYVQPGTSTSVTFGITKYSWLPEPYKAFGNTSCEEIDDRTFKTENNTYQYSKDACVSNCIRNYLFKQCNCNFFLNRGPEPFCSLTELQDCLFPHMHNISHAHISNCHCPTPCQVTEYEARLSVANFASTFIKDYLVNINLIKSADTIDENLIDLRIQYSAVSAIIKQQKPEITIEGILGNLGGHMGLFIGASVMSLFELLEFLIIYLHQLCKHGFQKTRKKK
ncbi:hypothetical protein LOTGIDRAFT_174471 [Lottia gigantea]|uniref:Uncharacterized protein n=1 Tax=Lottia gigantea TaxID=225164 RepID=V4ALL5_LOTGI|nr:hypothetical protein LOTGIDRAFT_174471 [Lottia gigantea]ESO98007.1 hypothetical protein LOTGIDRAFT_174471 [Lottia gigantea]